jgi:hypothetical protein
MCEQLAKDRRKLEVCFIAAKKAFVLRLQETLATETQLEELRITERHSETEQQQQQKEKDGDLKKITNASSIS